MAQPVIGFNLATFPMHDAIAEPSPNDKDKLIITQPYVEWFTAAVQRIDSAPHRITTIHLTNRSSSIGTSALPLQSTGSGLGRLSYYFRVATPATLSSTWQITIGWIDGGVACSFVGAQVNNGGVSSVQGDSIMVRADAPAVVTYSVAYSSSGSVAMEYNLDIVLESLMASEAA